MKREVSSHNFRETRPTTEPKPTPYLGHKRPIHVLLGEELTPAGAPRLRDDKPSRRFLREARQSGRSG